MVRNYYHADRVETTYLFVGYNIYWYVGIFGVADEIISMSCQEFATLSLSAA